MAELELGTPSQRPRVRVLEGSISTSIGRCPQSPMSDYQRRALPHFDAARTYQFITFRLADSLPCSKLRRLKQELADKPEGQRDREWRMRIDNWLDSGFGCCALRHPAMARTMRDALLHFDGERYHLIGWCIMPNHVHALIQTLAPLPRIIQSWKSYTGRWALKHANELGLGISGSFWMRDYWDRYIRDERHYAAALDYIHANPVKAGLCDRPEQWPWSSAGD